MLFVVKVWTARSTARLSRHPRRISNGKVLLSLLVVPENRSQVPTGEGIPALRIHEVYQQMYPTNQWS